MPISQEMFYSFIHIRFIVARHLDDAISCYSFQLAQQKTLMLHMLQNMRQDDQVETIVLKRQMVPVKYLNRFQIGNIPCLNMLHATFRYFDGLIFGCKVSFG